MQLVRQSHAHLVQQEHHLLAPLPAGMHCTMFEGKAAGGREGSWKQVTHAWGFVMLALPSDFQSRLPT
jgi:hypothetical protein